MNKHKDISLVYPTYYHSPSHANAYNCPHQYFFGPSLLVAPFLSKVDPDTRLSRAAVWLPPGRWYGFESGDEYLGDKYHVVYGKLDEIPIFAPQGAIIPQVLHKLKNKTTPILNYKEGLPLADCDIFHIKVFAGASNEFILYDDDGHTMDYQSSSNLNNTFLAQHFY